MKPEDPDVEILDAEPSTSGRDGQQAADSANSDSARLVDLLRRLADARDMWENAQHSGMPAAEVAASQEMASALDDALAALTTRLVDGAAVRLAVPEVDADTLLTHALPSLAALVSTKQDWFTPQQTILTILGDTDFAVELVRRTRTRTTESASAHTLRSLELRIAVLHTNFPPTQ